ncbi:MAG: ABC transporter ATP-binding protein [Sarcina sp.]
MKKLTVENLTFVIDNKKILDDISLKIKDGAFVGIIGANGSGKSTLLKNIYRIYKPKSGNILLEGENLLTMNPREVAKKIAVLAQESSTEFDFKVEDIVKMGRYPYKSIFEDYSKSDMELVYKMLEKVGLADYKDRNFNTLSGGEKQRTLIARALVQSADFLILDEPTNHLDIGYQLQIMDTVKNLKITTFSAIHDMNMATMYCDYIIVMKAGKIIASGETKKVLTKEMIKDVFNIECHVGKNPITNETHIFYISEHEHQDGFGVGHYHEDAYTGVHKH